MKFASFFLISVSSWCFISAAEVEIKKNALIFNLTNQQLEEVKSSFSEDKCASCLVVCPATSRQHRIIVDNYSITGNAIFLQEPFKNGVRVTKKDCDDPLRPALVQDKMSTNLYFTGYEFFYPEGSFELKFEDNYKNLIKVEVTDDEKNKSKSATPNENLVKMKEEDGKTKFEILEESPTTLVFYWISVLSIEIFEKGRQIKFTKDTINSFNQKERTMVICKDYNLGDELGILSTFARLATCTYLNIAYVWKGIAAGQLRKIDLFLYSLYREWPTEITIIFGIKGVSNGVTHHKLEKINSPENKFLRKFPKPVPEIIYRIVELKQNEKTNTAAVVILHNFLDSAQIEERICPVNSEVDGWNDIKPDPVVYPEYTKPSGLTYVCAVTTEIMKKLGAPYEVSPSLGLLTLTAAQKIKIKKKVEEMRDKAEDYLDGE